MKKFDKLCEVINNIASAVTVAMMVFLILLITWSVFSRFVLNDPVAWQYEVTLICLSWKRIWKSCVRRFHERTETDVIKVG